MDAQRTEFMDHPGLPVPDEIRDGVIADRIAGMEYPSISAKYGIHHGTARRICKRAVAAGQLTLQQIGASSRFGKPAVPPLPKADYDARWIARVKANCTFPSSGCWLWQGTAGGRAGYGQTNYRGKTLRVHRTMFQLVRGVTLTAKEYVCHRCDTPTCCNPDHLFVGDQFVNMRDSVLKGRHAEQLVTHCPRGHAYDEENTSRKTDGSRSCRICCRARQRVRSGWNEADAYSKPSQRSAA